MLVWWYLIVSELGSESAPKINRCAPILYFGLDWIQMEPGHFRRTKPSHLDEIAAASYRLSYRQSLVRTSEHSYVVTSDIGSAHVGQRTDTRQSTH